VGAGNSTVALTDWVPSGERVWVIRRSAAVSASFVGFRFPPEVILLAVRWYLRYVWVPVTHPDRATQQCHNIQVLFRACHNSKTQKQGKVGHDLQGRPVNYPGPSRVW
jgi:hypothetical protein